MKPLTPRVYGIAIVAAFGLVLFALGVQTFRLHRSQKAAEDNALRATNAIAIADVTRKVALAKKDSIRILGDSLHAVEHLGVQQPKGLKPSAIDRATGRTSVARGNVTVTPRKIATSASISSTVSSSGDVRSAQFHVDSSAARSSTRFVADVGVDIPPKPALASLRLGITFPPIELEPSIQCGKPDAGGIRPGTLAIVAPNGVDVVVRSLELDVHDCNRDFGARKGIRVPLWVAGAGTAAGIVAGVLLSR